MTDDECEYEAAVCGAGFILRTDRAILRITGTDRKTWLQGMVSNDVRKLGADIPAISACVLDSTGHVQADVVIVEVGDAILLDLPVTQAKAIHRKLEAYVVMEDVAIQDETGDLACVSVQGPKAGPDWLNKVLTNVDPMLVVPADHTGLGGVDIYLSKENLSLIVSKLTEVGATRLHETIADCFRIEAGIPKFGAEISEQTIPMEAGLEETHISFTKGCYLGQEIIARIHARGHVNRSLVGFFPEVLTDGLVGASVFESSSPDREIGKITSAAQSIGAKRPIALGYVRREFNVPGTVLVTTGPSGPQDIVVSELPFSISGRDAT